jgi:hypothetical protein
LNDEPRRSRELLGAAIADFGPLDKLQVLDRERIQALAAALNVPLRP